MMMIALQSPSRRDEKAPRFRPSPSSLPGSSDASHFLFFRPAVRFKAVGGADAVTHARRAMPLAGSSPGSDAFYRRSMRKGTGGDAEGEAMRANLTFQNTLRVDAHGAGTPDASQTLSAKRSRRARERAALARVSTPTEAEVDALLARLSDGSPSLLKAGITPPKPAWVPPKPAAADAAAFPAWLPVEAMPPARDASAAKTPPKPTRTIHFATPGEAATAAATRGGGFGDVPADRSDRSGRLPIFERLYRRVPSGQRAKFGFADETPFATSATKGSAPSNTSPKNANASSKPSFSPRFPKDLREKRREIASLRAELAARETAEAAGAANAAAAVAAEMARRGGLMPRRGSERAPNALQTHSETPDAKSRLDTDDDSGLAAEEAAARDALRKILSPSPQQLENRDAFPGDAFGSPTAASKPSTRSKTLNRTPNSAPPARLGALASDPGGVDWRFGEYGVLGALGGKEKAPWRERALGAEARRRAQAAAWEGEVRARAAAKAQTKQLVEDAERELEQLRRRRADIVSRQMRVCARTNAEAEVKRGVASHKTRFESSVGARSPERDSISPGTFRDGKGIPDHIPRRDIPGTSASPAAERSPLMASPATRTYGAAERPAPARLEKEKEKKSVSGAEAARSAAARVRAREREAAKVAAAAAAAAAAKAEAEMFRARRAAEREKKSVFARTASSSFLAPTAASVGKASRPKPATEHLARATTARSSRANGGERPFDTFGSDGRPRTPRATRGGEDATKKRDAETEARVDALERDVGLVRNEVAARGDAVRTELEGLRAQMDAMLQILSTSGTSVVSRLVSERTNAEASKHGGVSVTGSPVKSTTPPTPPRGAPPPRVDAKSAPASPPRAPAPRGGPSPAASPRAAAIPAERLAEIPVKSANPFLSG
jgi:hypothetical protein